MSEVCVCVCVGVYTNIADDAVIFNGAIKSFESRTDDFEMFFERCLCMCACVCEKKDYKWKALFGACSNSVWCDLAVAEGTAPGVPSNVYASETDRTYVVLSWTPPVYHNRAPMWYYIEKVCYPFDAHPASIAFTLLFTINHQFTHINEEAQFSVSISQLVAGIVVWSNGVLFDGLV